MSESDDAEAKAIDTKQLAEFLYKTFDLADHVRGFSNADQELTMKRINHMIDIFFV